MAAQSLATALTAPVQFWCGASFYVNAWKALKRHTDGYVGVGYRYGRLTFILYSHLLSSVVYRSGSQTRRLLLHYYLDPAGRLLRIEPRDKPRKRFAN